MTDFLVPEWPAPANVKALVTARSGGASHAPWDSLNLALHVGDDPAHVALNRAWLRARLPAEPFWLEQVHGVDCVRADAEPELRRGMPCVADASVSFEAGHICVVMTADCLPVLFCTRDGQHVGAAHAGWRGLLTGVLENTVRNLQSPASEVLAWLGPAIGPQRFEVGSEVRAAFLASDPASSSAFVACGDKWLADIYALARLRLKAVGVTSVHGGGMCTVSDEQHFFSYRRDGATGRMASLIWRE